MNDYPYELRVEREKVIDKKVSDMKKRGIDSANGWVSVNNKKPKKWKHENGELVNYLVYMPDYGVDIANYVEPAKRWVCMGMPAIVTHWMPMPEPPKE